MACQMDSDGQSMCPLKQSNNKCCMDLAALPNQHTLLRWSGSELQCKNKEDHFRRYQTRSGRHFSIIFVLNTMVSMAEIICHLILNLKLVEGTGVRERNEDNGHALGDCLSAQQQVQSSSHPTLIGSTIFLLYLFVWFVPFWRNERWLTEPRVNQLGAALLVLLVMLFTEYGAFLLSIVALIASGSGLLCRPIFYLIFCNETLLPFPKRIYSVVAYSIIVSLELLIGLCWRLASTLTLLFDMLFYLLAGLVAFYLTYLLEIVNRRAFLDHRKCVESKYKLTFEKDEQERLLSSCLPRHLMKKVREDIRSRFIGHWNDNHDITVVHGSHVVSINDPSSTTTVDGNNNRRQRNAFYAGSSGSIGRPFSEMYIDKYQNVTILYADIVNSMALTESLPSPKALVETLNTLFCRFDSRAENHNCLRIKILGDCYYCISGIPDQDQSHAANCLHMGLDMIDIIREFRVDDIRVKNRVDMRIGIHSGMILSGLLGLKKWQYDIWSIDTMKASQMEQEGQPGFVHITRETLRQIPASDLEKLSIKENHVLANETTFLIQRRTPTSTVEDELDSNQCSMALNRQVSIQGDNQRDCQATAHHNVGDSKNQQLSKTCGLTSCRRVLEVINSLRNYGEMIGCSNDSLSQTIDKMSNFKRQYNINQQPCLQINPIFLYFVQTVQSQDEDHKPRPKKKCNGDSFWYQLKSLHRIDLKSEWEYLAQADHLFPYYLIAVLVISTVVVLFRFLILHQNDQLPDDRWQFFFYNGNCLCYATVMVSVFALIYTLHKRHSEGIGFRLMVWLLIATLLVISTIMDTEQTEQHRNLSKLNATNQSEWEFSRSRYSTYSSILVLASISLFIRINLWFKFTLSTISLIWITICQQKNEDEREDVLHLHYLFIVYLMFHILDRQIEYISRLDFLWARKLKKERREAKLMREVNQLLLKNILPIHVAQKFLTNPEQANTLYYEPYDSCAVMFAAIPNFFKFYSENKDNDDGLQYLYLLNDIICQFDKLLILPRFKRRIEKIKTIGSTYMAASGLQPGRASIDSSVSTKQEVTNLVTMIRFAMSMIRVLNHFNSIPERNWVTHLELRVGISMGPVIAGVVGAIKPQYDIWGDTVNVASRMDTCGVLNKIQIPHHVAQVLLDNQLFLPYSRGIQNIKGKGKLETFLIDYDENECCE